jgi:hypothetical protein
MIALESVDEELKRVQQMHQICLYNFKDRIEQNVLMIIIFHVEKEINVN